MTLMKRLFAAAVAAGPLLAGPAGAQQGVSPPLSTEQAQAVGAAKGFNKCLRDGYNDPAYAAAKQAYEQERAQAQQDYDRERAAYIEKLRVFNAAFDVIATRDGEAAMMDDLNKLYSRLDRGDNYGAQGVIDAQMEALRAVVTEKVKAEQGLMPAEYPKDVDDRVQAIKPADPLDDCNEKLKNVLKVLKIHEWTFSSVLSDVVREQGGQRYNEMTGGPFLPVP